MKIAPFLFIGLVTHPASRYKSSQGSTGVIKRLEKELRQREINVSILVCTENFYDRPITGRMTANSQIAQKLAEVRWNYYLNHKSPPFHKLLIYFFKGLLGASRSLFNQKSRNAARRLINIELAHLWLMRHAIEAGATWTLILEDDAFCDDITDLVDGLLDIFKSQRSISYINLSRSFTPRQLGANRLLTQDSLSSWKGHTPRSILRASLPLTNTVCAVAYEATFLSELYYAIKSMGIFPVIPIDWKLNMVLLKIFSLKSTTRINSGCLFIEPGPIVQGSIHPQTHSD